MIHYYIKRKLVASPVKTLCEGVWVARPRAALQLSMVDCPECLRILIRLQEKRLKVLQDNLLKTTEVVGGTQ